MSSGLYRRPRRRPAHLRVKTGCLTCRKRKKKCDETPGRCDNCATRNLVCAWGNTVNHRGSASQAAGQVSSSASPRDAVSLDYLPASSPAVTSASRPLFGFLITTFLPQLIRPATDARVTDGLSRETLALAFGSPFFMHALLACCGAEIPTTHGGSRQLAQTHYTNAVAGLRNGLDRGPRPEQWVVIMLTTMMLCIYERSKPQGSSAVSIHLAGAARLIQLCPCRSSIGLERPAIEQAMHRLARESFIFHVATSLPFQGTDIPHDEIETALLLAEGALGPHFHPQLAVYPDSPVLGAPPRLFRCIYTVYRIYRDPSETEKPDAAVCRKLDWDLGCWYTRIGTFPSGLPPKKTAFNAGNVEDHSARSHTSVIGPRLYILGCRILLRRIPTLGLGPDCAIDWLIDEGIETIRQLQPGHDYFADYYCWPLLLIGLHLTLPSHRALLMNQTLAFWRATNNGTMRRLADMLVLRWESGEASVPNR